LYGAIGQFLYYKTALRRVDSTRMLYVAVPDDIFEDVFKEVVAEEMVKDANISIITYNIITKNITSWIK